MFPAVSESGVLAYVPAFSTDRSLVWVQRDGTKTTAVTAKRGYMWPRLSPQAAYVAATIQDEAGQRDIWVHDFRSDKRVHATTTWGSALIFGGVLASGGLASTESGKALVTAISLGSG